MDLNSLPTLDLLVLGALAASLIMGLMRGLIRELLSLLSWGGAVFIGFITYPSTAPLLQEWIPNEFFRNIAGGVIGFAIALIIFNIISIPLGKLSNAEYVRSSDRALGGLFGLIRGYVLVCILFAITYWTFEDGQPPQFVETGKTRPYIAMGAKEFVLLMSQYEETELFKRLQSISEGGEMALELHQKLLQPDIKPPKSANPETGYAQNQRIELDKVFESN